MDEEKNNRQRAAQRISIVAIVLAIIAIAGEAFIITREDTTDEVYKKAIRNEYHVFAPILPDTISLAGEPVPLSLYYVYEGLDRELSSIMYQQLNTQLVIKRANRYFPEIEEILKQNGVPEDMKYLCVTESSLTNATSPAKAQGFWQFLKETAEQYGLEVTDEIDMRNDLTASTNAACKYLKFLYEKFSSWTLAAAAYNRGHNGLSRQIEQQGNNNYYDLWLNQETSRYVYRILAYKTIMQHPQDYGFTLRKCDLYPTLPYSIDTLSGQNVNLFDYAREHGCNYRVFKMMNPWLTADILQNKHRRSYSIKLPVPNGTELKNITQKKKDTSLVERM